jgi:ribosomal protein S18 acetylase RimI-like enzyme
LCYNFAMTMLDLAPAHATAAAHLHISGQPGTFLTNLGPAVLTVFYRALPTATSGWGFVWLDEQTPSLQDGAAVSPATTGLSPIGFVAATTSTARLFAVLGTRYLLQFLPPLLVRYRRQPRLIVQSVQTLLYPLQATAAARVDHTTTGPAAELLSIMVEPAWRSQGIGAALLHQLITSCRARELSTLEVTVDAANTRAQHFYRRYGFVMAYPFMLYGRAMYRYRLALVTDGPQP